MLRAVRQSMFSVIVNRKFQRIPWCYRTRYRRSSSTPLTDDLCLTDHVFPPHVDISSGIQGRSVPDLYDLYDLYDL